MTSRGSGICTRNRERETACNASTNISKIPPVDNCKKCSWECRRSGRNRNPVVKKCRRVAKRQEELITAGAGSSC